MIHLSAILLFAGLLTSGELFATSDSPDQDTVTVEIRGTDTDARFDPVVVQVQPGDVIQFMVREGLHTVTAYHPDNRRPLRMPESSDPFDSGMLEQGDTWLLQVTAAGVYDYFCLPHEKMGHAGRILSGAPGTVPDYLDDGMPGAVLNKLNAETQPFLNNQ